MKKIFGAIGALLAIGLIVSAFILVPPHVQIRSVTPELPTKADLDYLSQVANGPTAISYINTTTQKLPDGMTGHSSFVVEWEDGKILLIDLGMDEKTAVEFGELLESVLSADKAVSHGNLPDFLGENMDRVKGTAFTHLHIDHVQGVEPVCASGARSIVALHTIDQMTKHNFRTENQFKMLENSSCIEQKKLPENTHMSEDFPGIGIFPLGGHTPGSTLFAIPIGDILWLLSGDITNTRKDMIEDSGKGWIYSYLLVPEYEARLEKLRAWLSDLDKEQHIKVIVSHDANALIESGMNEWLSD